MLKIITIIIFLLVLVQEFWFLTNLNKETTADILKVKVDKFHTIKDINSSIYDFFDTDLWFLTSADKNFLDKEGTDQESEDEDTNTTISIISKKNSKQLCKGRKCITIKGFMSNSLLLEDGDKMFSLRPGEVIFDMLKFTHYTNTKLFFEHNQSQVKYELDFFFYTQLNDINNTKNEKQKDKK